MSYVEPDEVREIATQMSSNTLEESALESLIERASRIFDLVCGVEPGYFDPVDEDAEAAEKVIYGDGTNYLRLPPYVAGSLNTTLSYPEGYTSPTFIEREGYLVFTSNGVAPPFLYSTGWYSGVPVTASAIWGYASTPADVKAAVIELVINLWRETDPAQVKLVNIEGQPLREKLPPRVNEIARHYRGKGVAFV